MVLVVKNLPANAGDVRDVGLIPFPWVGKIPWRRAWQPTPVFLTGESPWTEELEQASGVGDGQGSQACRSPWRCKESDTTERLN